jgi:MYXO-CTERM domain-containing protein
MTRIDAGALRATNASFPSRRHRVAMPHCAKRYPTKAATLESMRHAVSLVGLALGLVPVGVLAANALRPRTPAEFDDVPCMTVVDKSENPLLHIEYRVPYDDIDFTPDELPDTRRHQFFAFGPLRFDFALPNWINRDDYDRSEANGDFTRDYTDDDILEHSALWPAGTWQRITPDDARVPITHEQAAMGVDWDLSTTPVGTWVVATYTWEPDNNLWAYRPGAVKVVDPSDPDSGAPAAFLSFDVPERVTAREPQDLTGCVDAAPGSTMTASWGVLVGNDEPQWEVFLEDEPAVDGALTLPFSAPDEAAGSRVKVRLEVTDPDGRSYVAFSPPLAVVANPNPPEEDEEEGGGCSCGTGDRDAGLWMGLVLLVMIATRRSPPCQPRVHLLDRRHETRAR